jgi:CubicO group peptidase (beta-lactamase class C family)
MHSKKSTSLGLLLIVLVGSVEGTYAQIDKPVNLAFEKQLSGWLKETNVPAAGIAIIENGKLTYTKVFGELRKGDPTPAPPNSIFQVASLTKPIVEILTLKLVTSGKWNLDEPLANYWVDPDVQTDPRHKKLTTRHVLTHQSGFPNWRSSNKANKLEFMAEPGTKVNYSGEGLEYLRRALEKKFNEPVERLAQKHLFQPYGMKDTRSSGTLRWTSRGLPSLTTKKVNHTTSTGTAVQTPRIYCSLQSKTTGTSRLKCCRKKDSQSQFSTRWFVHRFLTRAERTCSLVWVG